MSVVPLSARVCCWLNAWLGGRAPADSVISGINGADRHVDFRHLAADEAPLSTALLLGRIRALGVQRASLSLPTPSDLLGLGGPAEFNVDALEVGEAIVLHGLGRGLIPSPRPAGVVWRASAARPPLFLPDVATSDRELRAAVLEAAETLAALDVASWSPDAADALMNLRRPADLDGAMPFASPDAGRTTLTGLRCREIVRLALRDQGGALTAAQAERRREALLPLGRAAHAAVVAGCSSRDGR